MNLKAWNLKLYQTRLKSLTVLFVTRTKTSNRYARDKERERKGERGKEREIRERERRERGRVEREGEWRKREVRERGR